MLERAVRSGLYPAVDEVGLLMMMMVMLTANVFNFKHIKINGSSDYLVQVC